MRAVIIAIFVLGAPASGVAQQQTCEINGTTMVCPNGVTVGGIGRSVFFGKRALDQGTGDYRTQDGREVFDLGNKGIIIGGSGQAERQEAPRSDSPQ